MATKAELEEKVKGLQKEVKTLKTEVKLLISDNDDLEARLDDLAALEDLTEEPDEPGAEVELLTVEAPEEEADHDHGEDCIILDGVKYKQVLVETAQELVQAVRRGEVLELQTCLVIDREGA